ncbi:MAG TPA: 50S ribosomal protein L6 [Syntrophales bacterium]|nr:50S ribosomal protein L6 [Syntrophales bacterium]HQB29329.1 50S ribosomal protein L6 [Syntrophales bacterium]HQN77506.1 50S ribosomal protein L6 [Syntrophales bacterium]HQQ27539.1 50S ribosomal protein L6 [Syntrophales bacterium]
MSRIGKKPIPIPKGVDVRLEGREITVKGPKGMLNRTIPGDIEIDVAKEEISVRRKTDDRRDRSLHGLTRTLISNMVTGVQQGFEKSLDVVGVGYRAEVDKKTLKMFLGYSAPMEYEVPDGVTVRVEKQTNMIVSGIDKEFVGRVAADIRRMKKPEPYKGKGIRYTGERVRKKVGKSAGK